MSIKTVAVSFAALVTFSAVSSAFASGGGGFGGGGSYGGSNPASTARPVDQTYETGKAIFKGRKRGEPKLSYCVLADDGNKIPVKRKSLKPFKGTSYNELANNLFDCEQPDKRINEVLSRDSFLYVVYYLNKRHKLDLRAS